MEVRQRFLALIFKELPSNLAHFRKGHLTFHFGDQRYSIRLRSGVNYHPKPMARAKTNT